MSASMYGNRNTDRDTDFYGGNGFADLEWEQEVNESYRHSGRQRRKPVNLTARIEEYMRSNW